MSIIIDCKNQMLLYIHPSPLFKGSFKVFKVFKTLKSIYKSYHPEDLAHRLHTLRDIQSENQYYMVQ